MKPMPFPLLSVVAALLHLCIGIRVVPELPAPWGAAFAVLLAASALLMPMGVLARRYFRPPLADRLAVAGLVFMGLFSSLLVLAFMRELILAGVWVAQAAGSGVDPAAWRHDTALAVPLVGGLVTLLGFWNARRTAAVRTVDIPLAGLPPALQGFTIAQISDVHVGPTIRTRYVEAIVARVNRIGADAVAITGDLVDGSVPELGRHVAPLAQLASRHGTFFVTGNHEYYSGAAPWMAELSRLGIRVLHNEHVVIEHGGARLVLAGVPDFSAGHFHEDHRSDPKRALAGAPDDAAARILLAHQPRTAPAAAEAGFDVQLSGHTHGGQFLPWNFFVRFQQPFTAGLHRLDGLWVYVSRGTGYWGPPKRFGAPSEITRLRLVATSS